MRRVLSLIILVLSISLVSCHRGPMVKMADGSALPLSALNGKWVVLAYWGSWCEACRDMMPQLNKFYHTRSRDTVLLGFNNVLLPSETLKKALAKLNVGFPVVKGSLESYYHLPPVVVEPSLFVLNPHGQLVKTVQGIRTTSQLELMMRELKREAKWLKKNGTGCRCGRAGLNSAF